MPTRSYGIFQAIKDILPSRDVMTIFVVGCGLVCDSHEINWFLKHYPETSIIGFEPNPAVKLGLDKKYGKNRRVRLFHMAVSDSNSIRQLNVNRPVGATSILEWNPDCECKPASWTTERIIPVASCTLDSFCDDNNINKIDLLFMDAQGAEPLIIAGAKNLIAQGRINVIVGEAIFTSLYERASCFCDAYTALAQNGYDFHGFYRPVYGENGKMHHCDYMFRKESD